MKRISRLRFFSRFLIKNQLTIKQSWKASKSMKIANNQLSKIHERRSKDEELKELGNMLAATKTEDTKRLESIIKRLTEIANNDYRIKPKPVELLYEFIYWQQKNNSFRTNDEWLTKDEIHSKGYDNYLLTGRALNQETHELETKEFGEVVE